MGVDPTEVTEVQLIDIASLFGRVESQTELLRQIRDALLGPSPAQEIVRLTVSAGTVTNTRASHVQLRCQTLLISSDTAANVTLTIGTLTLRFRAIVGVAGFPFPYVFQRGVDVSATFSASATGDVYLIGTTE